MKRFWNIKNYGFMAVATLASALAGSCSSKSETAVGVAPQGITSFKHISVDTTMTLFSNYEKPDCRLQLNFDLPAAASSQNVLELTNTLIVTLTQDGTYASDKNNDPEMMIRNYTKTYIRNYLEEGNDAINNFGDDMVGAATWMSYEENCDGTALYNDNDVFSYSVRIYSYTGGAHGNSTNCVASLDLKNLRNVTLDYLFAEPAIGQIREMMVDYLKNDYQLLNEEFDVTENFYLSDKGITFIYDPFEIAAYSYGEIAITLGWDQLRPLVSDNSPLKQNQLITPVTTE